MHHLTPALAGVLFVALLHPAVVQAESPVVGTWKVTVLPRDAELTLWLVRIGEKEGKLTATLLSAGLPDFKGTAIDPPRLEENSLRLSFKANVNTYEVIAYLPRGAAAPRTLLGSIEASGRRDLVRMEKTDARELDGQTAIISNSPALDALDKALATANPKDRMTALQEILKRFPGEPTAFHTALQLAPLMVELDESEGAIRGAAEQVLRLAAPYGPEMERQAARQLAQYLLRNDSLVPLALTYAQMAEKLLPPQASPAVQVRVLQTLARALTRSGKAAEASVVERRVTELNDRLDAEFARTAVPFKPVPFAGRKGKSDRVAVVELFTGAQCPPCVAADVAFDALLATYQPRDVVFLQYHLHIPGPDPLANADSDGRAAYYGVDGTPTLLLNGQPGPPVFGLKQQAQERYGEVRKAIEAQLELPARTALKLAVQREGTQLTVECHYSEVPRASETTRLRLVLIEEVVRYPGGNGQRLHHHVVRAFIGGIDGLPIKAPSGMSSHTVKLDGVRKQLEDYLTEFGKTVKFPDEDRPLDLRKLKLVALIQDEKTREVIQAVQVDVPDSP